MTRYKLVPVEPTEGMLRRGVIPLEPGQIGLNMGDVKEVLAGALAAAPEVGEDVVERVAWVVCDRRADMRCNRLCDGCRLDARAIIAELTGGRDG